MVRIHDVVGFVGVALIVGAYAALQLGPLRPDSPSYPALNAVGAALILISLMYAFNAAAFAVEIFWLAISALGLLRALNDRRSG
jgi:hypothetical protein